jgi:hypothetical protein
MRKDNPTSPILLKALRSTIQNLERDEDLGPDDPVLCEIKSSILRAIAARELKEQRDGDCCGYEEARESAFS